MRRRTLTAVATAAVFLLAAAAALPGGAAGVTVQAGQDPGTRQLFVEDLAGQQLTTLPLSSSGALQPFRVRVVDSSLVARQAFSVNATINNLYLKNQAGHDFGVEIPSGNVAIGFLNNPTQLLGLLPVQPTLLLNMTFGTCAAITSQVNALLGGAPTITQLQALTGVCSTLGGIASPTSGSVSNLPVAIDVLSLTPTLNSLLSLAGQEPGPFTNADYSSGTIGFDDPAKAGAPAATVRRVLTGTVPTDLSALLGNLDGVLQSVVATLPDFAPAGGVSSKATTEQVIAALMASGNSVATAYGQLLSTLPIGQATSLITGLVHSLNLKPLDDILALAGSYFSFPGLSISGSAPTGLYEGTLTLTLVQS